MKIMVEGGKPPKSLVEKFDKLRSIIKGAGSVAVAFSGGVDSSFLLKTCVDVLGPGVLALHVTSTVQPPGEGERARAFIAELGCKFNILSFDPLSWPEFVSNPKNRCYHCKKKLYAAFLTEIGKFGIQHLLDGTNADDLQQDRPGLRVLEELNIAMPLAQSSLTKSDIRQLSRSLGLASWNAHASSCLATRIPSGTKITSDLLERVRIYENFLQKEGFSGCRVRIDRGTVKIDILRRSFKVLLQEGMREKITLFFKQHGIEKIFLNLEGRPDNLT